MNIPKKSDELKHLLEFISEDDSTDIKVVKEELLLAGIQPDELVKEGNELVRKLIAKERRELAKIKLYKMKEMLNAFMQTNKEINGVNAKEFLLGLLGSKNSEVFQASFRKVENLSDKEALEILNENKLLEFITKIMNEEK